ncbi:MAG TPA: hypothetical protein VIK81_04465 [Patescibacteria group bacterium]
MERINSAEDRNVRSGVSLKGLIPLVIKRHEGKPGPPISKRLLWVSQAIETQEFWLQLNRHMAEDTSARQSVGGIFTARSGKLRIGEYTWSQIFVSIDHFLKEYNLRAIEFLFRDFLPENKDLELKRLIDSTRELARNKYPRFRRLWLDDYIDVLNSMSFWFSMETDLRKLSQPVSNHNFFEKNYEEVENRSDLRNMSTRIRQNTYSQFLLRPSINGQRARLIEYHNFAQIIRDYFRTNSRAFLLKFEPSIQDPTLIDQINRTKKLIDEKILPIKPLSEPIPKLDRRAFQEILKSRDFWLGLLFDIQNHYHSQKQSYSLSFFLRQYNSKINDINQGKVGTYAELLTPFVSNTKNFKNKIKRHADNLVDYLMWELNPPVSFSKDVLEVKAICAEMFPNDCLFVDLQTLKFWEGFQRNLAKVSGNHTFDTFLRYFNSENPSCDRRKHKKGTALYQIYYHRAYHKPKDLERILQILGLAVSFDFKENLSDIFWHFAPASSRQLLIKLFPQDFDNTAKIFKIREKERRVQVKELLTRLIEEKSDKSEIVTFTSKNQAKRFRNKIWSAARTLNLTMKTRLVGFKLEIKINPTRKRTRKELSELEKQVIKLRNANLQNKQIAHQLQVNDYDVEFIVGKLIKQGKLKSRRSGK